MILRTAISIALLAISFSCLAEIPLADIRQQLLPSVLNEQQMLQELAWFRQASSPFKGKTISVVSEDYPPTTGKKRYWPKSLKRSPAST
jgi:hypothetical protein